MEERSPNPGISGMTRRGLGVKEGVNWVPLMAKVLVWAFLGMGGFEFLKFLLFPTISIWESLALSFLFVTIVSGIIASRVVQEQRFLQRELTTERRLCLEAEEHLCQLRKELGSPFHPLRPESLSS
jgi:hypothetical protein